jgi:hypothetical protein
MNARELVGVTLVYVSASGESAIYLSGEAFTPEDKTEDEIFRVWKNTVAAHWNAKLEESGLKVDNNGIGVKLRASAPAYIVIRSKGGEQAFRWNKSDSIYDRVGLLPTKADIQEVKVGTKTKRTFKKDIHKVAAASFAALKSKFEFEEAKPKPETKPEAPKAAAKAGKKPETKAA